MLPGWIRSSVSDTDLDDAVGLGRSGRKGRSRTIITSIWILSGRNNRASDTDLAIGVYVVFV